MAMQALYKRVCEYMELDDRVEVLNNRLMVCCPLCHACAIFCKVLSFCLGFSSPLAVSWFAEEGRDLAAQYAGWLCAGVAGNAGHAARPQQ